MAGQPLAWMEASNLPDEAFSVKALIDRYKEVQYDFHQGVILPIGEEPSGRSWTGFQSISDDKSGYLLVYRENKGQNKSWIETWLPAGAKIICMTVLGNVKAMTTVVGRLGTVEISLPAINDFVMYKYEIK